MSDVQRSLQSLVSTIQSVVLAADVFQFFYKMQHTSNLSLTLLVYDVSLRACARQKVFEPAMVHHIGPGSLRVCVLMSPPLFARAEEIG